VLDPDIKHLLRFPESGAEQAQRVSQRQLNYLYDNGSATMSHVERQRAKMAGRSTGGHRRPAARPQEPGIWAAKLGWK